MEFEFYFLFIFILFEPFSISLRLISFYIFWFFSLHLIHTHVLFINCRTCWKSKIRSRGACFGFSLWKTICSKSIFLSFNSTPSNDLFSIIGSLFISIRIDFECWLRWSCKEIQIQNPLSELVEQVGWVCGGWSPLQGQLCKSSQKRAEG